MHDNAIIKPSCGKYTDLLGEIRIGDNCFIGAGVIILPGCSIAANTIVGAGSVVTNSVDREGLVIAGNPARVVCTVQDYYEKNKDMAVNLDGKSKEDIIKMAENGNSLIKRKAVNYNER